jgi:hypothetical protein
VGYNGYNGIMAVSRNETFIDRAFSQYMTHVRFYLNGNNGGHFAKKRQTLCLRRSIKKQILGN